MSGLDLHKVDKAFGAVKVVHDVNLQIDHGEFVVFVGPSGCGKSTLLRMIAGLEETTSGVISIDGQDVTHIDASDRGVAMVFQSYALYPHMTARQNMGFGLRMTGSPKEYVDKQVDNAARILHLEELLNRKPKELSGGQRQRVAIGRAIVRRPKVFLLDEPLSNLDAELRVQMRLEIAKLHKQLDATMIYVTHDQVEAMTLADKIVVLRSGRVEQIGRPLDLYDDPANLFVAGFMGSPKMNFLPVGATPSEGGLTVALRDFPSVSFFMPLQNPLGPSEIGRDLMLGIRPEHFSLEAPVMLDMRVDVVEHLGDSTFAYSSLSDDRTLTVERRQTRDIPEDGYIRIGFDPAAAFLFDESSGLRIR
jgi:lactose/L-arabinose transport system ATP-binding protein